MHCQKCKVERIIISFSSSGKRTSDLRPTRHIEHLQRLLHLVDSVARMRRRFRLLLGQPRAAHRRVRRGSGLAHGGGPEQPVDDAVEEGLGRKQPTLALSDDLRDQANPDCDE